MFTVIEFLFILLLIIVLLMLRKNERFSQKQRLPKAEVEEYWTRKERRSHIRFRKNLDVTYLLEKKPHLQNTGMTIDISEGGMKILLDKKLPKGSLIDLMIRLPGSDKIAEVEGEVIWSEEAKVNDASGKRFFHSGIKFSAIKDLSGNELIEYIKSLSAAS